MPKLLSSLPVGSLVKDTGTTYNGKPIIWKVLEHGHAGDPEGSTALITQKIISVKSFDAIESGNSDSGRRSYGNNRYLYSTLRQWLNSSADAGKWYAAQHSADAAPTNANVWSNYNEYDQEAGFLSGFSEKMRSALLTVTKRTAKNTACDGGGYEDISDKIFLLSNTEVGLSNENNVAEGSIYSLFNTSAERKAYPTAEAVSKSEYTSSGFNANAAWYWWLRSPYSGNSYDVRGVNTDGSLNNYGACNGCIGVRPACAISSSIFVSSEADADGVYTIQWNSAPTITTDCEENLGDKNAPFAFTYTIEDADNDDVTASITLDSETLHTIDSVVQGYGYRLNISGTKLNSLTDGTHTIKIIAGDRFGNSSEKSVTFNKTTATVAISGTDGSIGNKWDIPAYIYSVTSMESKPITVTEIVDDAEIRTIENADQNVAITAELSDVFAQLEPEKEHTLTIKAVDSDGTEVYRYITFKKLPSELSFETRPLETDAAPEKVILNLDYVKTGNPKIEIEATNCPYNGEVIWEDCTEEVLSRKAYTFKNQTFESDRYGISIRITIAKNENTERVYCGSFGFCFD